MRVRPLLMTVFTTFFGLLPLMFTTGTGAQVMQRLATPMVGGLFTAALLTLVVLPAAYMLIWRNRLDVARCEPLERTGVLRGPTEQGALANDLTIADPGKERRVASEGGCRYPEGDCQPPSTAGRLPWT